ncbi:MAG: hypothetical protein OXI67_08210 [Candidatus Poribacteria bacterium]|nr:hypothetical protein [Candidatus Poribacteria bacterium]
MKQLMSLTLIITCLCIFACGDRTHVDILTNITPHIAEDTVTDLTPEAWELLNKFREGRITQLEYYKQISPAERWGEEYEQALIDAKELQIKQETFYNRYIDADGIAIVGNDHTPDHYFIDAKNVFLLMTSKRPKLRDPMRNKFYLTVAIHAGLIPELGDTLHRAGWAGTCAHRRWYPPPPNNAKPIWIGLCAATVYPTHYKDVQRYYKYLGIVVHELAHKIDSTIRENFDKDFFNKIDSAYENAKENETWTEEVLRRSPGEYWAELTSIWFYGIGSDTPTFFKVPVFKTYEELEAHDPQGYALLNEWYPQITLHRFKELEEKEAP